MTNLNRLNEYQDPNQKLSEETKRHMGELALRLERVFGPWLDWDECIALVRILEEYVLCWEDGFLSEPSRSDMSWIHASLVATCLLRAKFRSLPWRQLQLEAIAVSPRNNPRAMQLWDSMLEKLRTVPGISVEEPTYDTDIPAP